MDNRHLGGLPRYLRRRHQPHIHADPKAAQYLRHLSDGPHHLKAGDRSIFPNLIGVDPPTVSSEADFFGQASPATSCAPAAGRVRITNVLRM